jgi:hypothetical protein
MYSNNQTLCFRQRIEDDYGRRSYLDVVANHNTHMFEVSIGLLNGDITTRCFRLPSEAADFTATVLTAIYGHQSLPVSSTAVHTAIIDGLNTGGVA